MGMSVPKSTEITGNGEKCIMWNFIITAFLM